MKVYQENAFLVIETAAGVRRMYSRQRGGVFGLQQQGNYVSIYIMLGQDQNETILKSILYSDVLKSDGSAAGANIGAVITYLQNLIVET